MTRYRIHRIKDAPKEHFRWAVHTGGLATVKAKDYRDYDVADEIEAATPYVAWASLAAEGKALSPGDLLEAVRADGTPGELLIAKYVGFEPAQWFVPEPPIPVTLDNESQSA